MQHALEKVDADIDAVQPTEPAVVLLGDYIDRGPDSATVLDYLVTLCANEADAVVCLRGNHEQMMLDFLNDPQGTARRWLKFGGMDTLHSYGISCDTQDPDKEELYRLCEELHDALPPLVLDWMNALPLSWSTGNVHCAHAGMDPALSPRQQSEKTLLWGCDSFMNTPRTDGQWVVHGHTIVDRPIWENSRVSLDTGCYLTGDLTVAAFTDQGCRIL